MVKFSHHPETIRQNVSLQEASNHSRNPRHHFTRSSHQLQTIILPGFRFTFKRSNPIVGLPLPKWNDHLSWNCPKNGCKQRAVKQIKNGGVEQWPATIWSRSSAWVDWSVEQTLGELEQTGENWSDDLY